MPRPRVFISSTYYDLKHVRASLQTFIGSLGYEAILSEKGDIAFDPALPLDESCYREVLSADILVLIIGGRYGSEKSGDVKTQRKFFERYDSITKQEYKNAAANDIPVYILVESAVESEYRTFSKNRGNQEIQYAHVDSSNIFHLLDEILGQRKNNPLHTFDHYNDIERWLREQWAGLFRELLNRSSGQMQLASLQGQVGELSQINQTLKRYLEEVVTKLDPTKAAGIIKTESARLQDAQRKERLKANMWVNWLMEGFHFKVDDIYTALVTAESPDDLAQRLVALKKDDEKFVKEAEWLCSPDFAPFTDLNQAREILGLPPFAGPSVARAKRSLPGKNKIT